MNAIFFTSGEGFSHIARAMPVAGELEKRGHILHLWRSAAAKFKTLAKMEMGRRRW